MGSKTDYLEHAILNFFLVANSDGYVAPPNVYLALFTSGITEDGSATEVVDVSYARQVISFVITDNVATNSTLITFPIASVDWGTVTDFGIFDQLTNGNMLYYGTLPIPRDVLTGDIVTCDPGSLNVSED